MGQERSPCASGGDAVLKLRHDAGRQQAHPLQARIEDRFGQWSEDSEVVTVTLDDTPPVGWVCINGDDDFTDQRQVNLTVGASSDDAHYGEYLGYSETDSSPQRRAGWCAIRSHPPF